MKRVTSAATLAATLLTMTTAAIGAVDVSIYDPSKVTSPPIGKIPSVTPERYTMPNGIVVFLLEDHDLPVVSGSAYVPSSPSLVPPDRVGLAGIAGEVMRSGGTKRNPGDRLDDRLAAIGASVSTSLGNEQAGGGFRTLTENTAEVIGVFADVLRNPEFPDEKIELAKVGLRRSIASRNDEMFPILFRTSAQAVYGKDSPWARTPEYATIEPVNAADCRRLHAQVFAPERLVLAVYGDFKTAEMKKLLLAHFGDWKKSGSARPQSPPTPTRVTPRLVFAPKEDVTQTGILVAQPGYRMDDPDHASMQVLEQALGGGFSSRMFTDIRTTRGLAYATGAQAGADMTRPGVFVAFSLTKSESTFAAADLVREHVRRVTQSPLTEAELATAKQAVANSFVFNFEERSQTLFRQALYETIGYPLDFLDRYQKALEQVTAQSVLDAAKRKITPDQQVLIVVGREKDFDRKLEANALPVERMDISIPPPPSKTAGMNVTPEALAKGRQWLRKAADLAGGSGAWAAVKSVKTEQQASVSMQGQSIAIGITQSWVLPDKQLSIQKLPFGEMKQGVGPGGAWASAMGQIQDQPKAVEELRKDYERSLFRLFAKPDDVQLAALDEPVTVDGVAHAAAVVQGGTVQDLMLLFAPDGRLARIDYMGQGPQGGPAKVTEVMADWKPEGAIQYPRSLSVLMDGKPFLTSTLDVLQLNPPLADDLFAKPAK